MRIGTIEVSCEHFPTLLGRIELMDMLKEMGVRSVLATSPDMVRFSFEILCLCEKFEDIDPDPGRIFPKYHLICTNPGADQEKEDLKFEIITEKDYQDWGRMR